MDLMSHSSSFLLPTIPADSSPSLTYALVVLNQSLPRFTPLLWNHAQLRLCADGGANRLYEEMPQLLPHQDAFDIRNRFKPDIIKGDMDSIREEVLDFYKNLGTKIVDESDDQDTTDLHKCVAHIYDLTPNPEKSKLCILVAGALGGRFDHEVGNINVLYRFSTIRIILLSDDCLIHLLPKTHHHEIHIQSSVEGPHCGLIPIGMPSGSTTTTGLQWDLTHVTPARLLRAAFFAEVYNMIGGRAARDAETKHWGSAFGEASSFGANDTEMRFGGLISTSNIAKEEKITVRSDSDILWTISIKKP